MYEASSNSEWGEHELDYILFLHSPDNLTVKPNEDEVQATEWVGRHQLTDFLRDLDSRNVGVTPWFKLCSEVT